MRAQYVVFYSINYYHLMIRHFSLFHGRTVSRFRKTAMTVICVKLYSIVKLLGRAAKPNCLVSYFVMLTTTCFGHCEPSSGNKNVYIGKLYRV